jgi:hypothetical protein
MPASVVNQPGALQLASSLSHPFASHTQCARNKFLGHDQLSLRQPIDDLQ